MRTALSKSLRSFDSNRMVARSASPTARLSSTFEALLRGDEAFEARSVTRADVVSAPTKSERPVKSSPQ